jgi:hypothetical protein
VEFFLCNIKKINQSITEEQPQKEFYLDIMTTTEHFEKIVAGCLEIFEKKTKDYGTAWRILRLPSITDQIYIKAKRIRSIQEKGTQKVQSLGDDIISEFKGIINYCVMAIIQSEIAENAPLELPVEEVVIAYHKVVSEVMGLLGNKNHDYGEAWRDMRVSSMTDIILMKLLRIKQIEDNEGKTLISEGLKANYQDIINYAVFCLIKLDA